MCGVIGLIYERNREDLGKIAGELLKTLEYRGYDSTGAAIQDDGDDVVLRKGVGAPSVMIHKLGIVDLAGQILCGQVRWATFGAVDDLNSQPHVVRCKTFLYGAHNGNVTNCDDLKDWLITEGHHVLSDNDGEMVVHTVEHFFAIELEKIPAEEQSDGAKRRAAMRDAIIAAAKRLEGSYAAIVVDPVSRTLWAIKQGSSLYFGLGDDDTGNRFTIASSDLSSVLKLTRIVVPLSEGELVEYTPAGYQIYAVRDRQVRSRQGTKSFTAGQLIERAPVRSRLRAKDTALVPPFETFMDQEIHSQVETSRNVVNLFRGGGEMLKAVWPYLESMERGEYDDIRSRLDVLRAQRSDDDIRVKFLELMSCEPFQRLLVNIPSEFKAKVTDASHDSLADQLLSSDAGLLTDLLTLCRDDEDRTGVRLLDVILEKEEVEEFSAVIERFYEICLAAIERRGRFYIVCCGTSFNAAKAASLFFNEIANVQVRAVLPGEFRGECEGSLQDGDVFVGVSQSGETKDLIDVVNDVIDTGRSIDRVAIVNNVNSTLAQEKSDLIIPLRCGLEIAVPATKSYINQLTVFYCLALGLAEKRLDSMNLAPAEREALESELERRRQRLPQLPTLISETLDRTAQAITRAADLLYLSPSVHLLGTKLTAVAKEGALKIREVVLNHTEGYEGSEFKHGPNTILGFNTLLGPKQAKKLLERQSEIICDLVRRAGEAGADPELLCRVIPAASRSMLELEPQGTSLSPAERALVETAASQSDLFSDFYEDYPLVYITGPQERDVALTVSQINTHKIRGAKTVIVAEDHPALRGAAAKAPANNPRYQSVYITLPRSDDTLMVVFTATVVLQKLALEMSELKKRYLDDLGIEDHGVHPDVPKNVSKSITVD